MHTQTAQKSLFARLFPFSWRDLSVSVLILSCAVGVCILLQTVGSSDGFASPVFVLAILCISRFTTGYLFGLLSSLLGVFFVNVIFTYPYWSMDFSVSGYPLTFVVFLAVSVVTGALTTQVRQQERVRAEIEKETMRANLLRSVSHDIRTPLTSIVGSTSVLLETPDLPAAEQRELLENTRSEAQWLIQVVENLLSITRIGEDRAQITKEAEAAEEVLGEAVRKFRRRYPDIRVTVSAPEELLMVPMDAILIEQVLSNLLENAAIHGKTTSHIHISVQTEADRTARFSVTDDGAGIPAEEAPYLFDGTLKRTVPPSGDGKRNMGLGLSVCLAIVRAHGGTMGAKNPPCGGAEFFFRLPLEL